MKKLSILSVMLLVVAFLFPAAVAAQQYTADKGKTVVKWEGSKVVGGSHYGTISLQSGSISLEKGLPVSGEIVVDMTTIVDTDLEGGMKERLEGHLKSDDFFGVEKFPVATLVVKGAKANDDGTVTVSGHLTIKGKTNEIKFSAKPVKQGDATLFSGKMEVDRSLYDVRYGSGKFFADLGDRAINDIFTLEFDLYLVK